MLMELLFLPEAARVSPPHGDSADTTEDNDNQDTDTDGQHCHHGHWLLYS